MKFILLAFISLAAAAVGQEPEPALVKDINSLPSPSLADPQHFCTMGDSVYFRATSPTTGTELWKTDGTAEGTVLVKDIRPGIGSSSPEKMTAMGNMIFFSATDGSGMELWKSDGTAEGTVLVKDIYPYGGSYPGNFKALGDRIFFTAVSTSSSGRSMWMSDGTAAGTGAVNSFAGTLKDTQQPIDSNGILYFGNTGFENRGLYRMTSDGIFTAHGLMSSFTSGPDSLISFQGKVFYRAEGSDNQSGLWCYDHAGAGVQFIMGGRAEYLQSPQVMGGSLYFLSDKALWKSDGTTAGTVILKDFNSPEGQVGSLNTAGNKLFFTVTTAENGEELWTSDGTTEGTVLPRDINPGPAPSNPHHLIPAGDVLYFWAYSKGGAPAALWRSDGTAAGTSQVKQVDSRIAYFGDYAVQGDTVYFQGVDADGGWSAWKSDGTASGTLAVPGTLRAEGNSTPAKTISFKRGAIFSATDGIHGTELWHASSDGSDPVMLGDLFPGAEGSSPEQMTVVGDWVYFLARPGPERRALYVTDGSPAGTRRLRAVWDPDPLNNPNLLGSLAALGDMLLFSHDDGIHGEELWCSHGDAASTVLLKDIDATGGSAPRHLTVMNGVLYFFARDPEYGHELWRSDGTAAGTVRITDILPGADWNYFNGIAVMGGALYFRADDGVHGGELWKSDGTAAGTSLVKDVAIYNRSEIENLTTAGERIFFTATTDSQGMELWTSDGTEAGTLMLNIYPGIIGATPEILTACGSKVFFTARGATNSGRELWVSDGTADGTFLVKDINPGNAFSDVTEITSVEDRVYFGADDGIHGKELWRSDGTTAGTVLVADLVPGSGASSPSNMAFSDGRLFFSATTNEVGTELFSIPEGRHLEVSAGTGAERRLVSEVLHTGSPLSGVPAEPVTVTLRNHGWYPLDLSSVALDGPQVAEFQLTAPGNLPKTLQRGESVELTVLFTPAATGVRSAALRIMSTDYDEPDRTITLAGFGNTAPQFSGHEMTATTMPVVIPQASILAEASDGDGDALRLTLSSVTTAQNGRLEISGNVIIYYPPTGLSGSDSFDVVIDDGHGQSVSGTVTVIIPESGLVDMGLTRPRMELMEGDNRWAIRFKGLPGGVYRILRSIDLKTWEEVDVKTLGQDGLFDWDDADAPSPRAFYQIEGPGF